MIFHKTISEHSSKIKPLIAPVLIIFIASIILAYILYCLTLAMDLPLGDHWRWIKSLLIPLSEGELSFAEFISGEFKPFSHSHIPTLFFFWINYHFFNLNYELEFYIGLTSHLIYLLLFSKLYFHSVKEIISLNQALLVLFLLISIIFNPLNVIPWSLVQFEYLYFLLAFILMAAFSKHLNNSLSLLSLSFLIGFIFFFGDAMGVSAILSIISFIIIFELKSHYRTLAMIIFVLVVCYFLADLLIPGLSDRHSPSSKLDALMYVSDNPLATLSFILKSFSHSLLHPGTIRQLFGSNNLLLIQYIVSFIMSFYILAAVILFFRYRKKLILTALPMLLILFFLITILGIISARLAIHGPVLADAQRYKKLFQLGLIGATWINMTILLHFISKAHKFKPVFLSFIFCITTIITSTFLAHSTTAWLSHERVVKNRQIIVDTIRRYANDDSVNIGAVHSRCNKDFCQDSIEFLQKNKLSVFRDQ